YNFSFFASRNGAGDRNTVFIINGTSVTLNASLNTGNIVQIKNITPDANGNVTIDITTTSTALFGYLNGIIIQAVPNTGGARVADRSNESVLEEESSSSISAYPNPFVDRVTVSLDKTITGKFDVNLISLTGTVVFGNSYERKAGEDEVELLLREELAQGV